MKRIGAVMLIGLLLIVCGAVMPASAMSGTGDINDPYIISSKEDLYLLSGGNYFAYVGNDKYFELGRDIGTEGITFTFTPIGTNQYKFNGHFDGKNHKIIGMVVSSNPAGLFSYVTSGASISNIEFHNAQITGTGDDGTGVLCGQCYQATNLVTVSNVNVYDSKVTAAGGHVGGISGWGAYASSTVKTMNCNVERSVITNSAGEGVGGISGTGVFTTSTHEFIGCNVNECVISCTTEYAGGISGHGAITDTTGKWIDCKVSNCIIMASDTVGGISGSGSHTRSTAVAQNCNIENCYIYGVVSSTILGAGGIFGYGTYQTATSCTITDCHVLKSTIRVVGSYAGGIYGNYRGSGGQPVVSGCTVTDCTVIAGSYGGGITGGYGSI